MENLIEKALDIIERTDNEIFEVESQYLDVIAKSAASSGYKKTCSIFLGMFAAINSLKLGVFELSKISELYSIKCLYRVLLEHFIKMNYLFYEFCKNKTDEICNDYILFSRASDILDLTGSYSQIKKLIDQTNNKVDTYTTLCDLIPEYKKFDRKIVLRKINAFKKFNMLQTLMNASQEKENNPFEFLLNILPEYSELSAFIHGSPQALSNICNHHNNDSIAKESVRYARAALNMTIVSKHLILIALGQIDKKAFVLDKSISIVWKKFGNDFNEIEKIIAN